MRVKRLEVQGFKSFKDKTVIHFDHTITGIVGPNGSGKSNIVDAFFWVMGEQSYKHMRGSGSDDLIFNGSSKYSPLGMAEATLVMETDYIDPNAAAPVAAGPDAPAGASAKEIPVHLRSKEVSVTRRLYRGGEGEYFINGVPARLKDIKELFMDTGVGAKGYSVIEQGQIGKIVNSKPEERRLLIEEAAGIAKYKARKTESIRKMEATQANLARLHDIIQEIERSLGSLERQAQKARQYRKYKDELLDKEMTWGRRKTQVLRQKLDQLKNDRDAMEQMLAGLRAELQVSENTIETDRLDQLNDTKLAEELSARLQSLSSELTRAQSALDLSRRRQGDLQAQLESLNSERGELVAQITEESERLATQEVGSTEAQSEFENASSSAASLDEQVRVLRTETEQFRRAVEQAKRELMNAITASTDLASRTASLSSKVESARAQAERMRSQVSAQAEKANAAREESERAVEAAGAVRERREGLREQVATLSADLATRERAVKDADRAREQADKDITKLRSRLGSLEELAAAYEGFADGPKAALDWARGSGAEGRLRTLAESIDVQPGYDAALEGWLESRLQDLISDDASVALEALGQIREGKQGRAAVHVAADPASGDVHNIGFSQVRETLEAAGFEVLGELADVIKTSEPVAMSAVAQVAMVRDFSKLPAFLAEGGLANLSGWAIVTLDGQSVDSHGLLRGGSTDSDKAASVLGRKRAIADLQTQVATAHEALSLLEAEASEKKAVCEETRERLHVVKTETQELEVQLSGLERDVVQMARSLKEAESGLELLELEAAEMETEASEAIAEREKIEGLITETAARRTDLEERIARDEAVFIEKEQATRTQEGDLQSIRVNEASLRERAISSRRELEAGRTLIQDRQRRLADVERVLERANQEHEQHSGGDSDLEERIGVLATDLSNTQESLSAAKDRLEQSSAKVNSALDRIKKLHSVGNEKTNESNTLALDIERLSGELTHLVQNLEEKYGPGCLERPVVVRDVQDGSEMETSPIQEEMTGEVVTTEMSAEEELLLGEEVERLRERIRRLGEVNVMAIEEFEELKKRYDYLMTEKGDLETSIRNLEEAIEHINKTSEERFRKAFTAIAERFERLFPIIFGGGSASLSLVYPEGSTDILDAGVDIMAQPPGKKVSNITLLSGGEKALTAVSLIFAIFMVKPSPFCLLDEVDAPLDDANIGKFNALLREMSVKSQFILITHNKKTMELNDTLYGVTMEEPGVSKMVSIQLH